MVINGLEYKTAPWEHQRLAVEYLVKHDRAALYTDMGTGKTKIIIDTLHNRRFLLVLIVCTNRGCDVWEEEFQKHSYLPRERVLNLSGVETREKIRRVTSALCRPSEWPLVVVVNYEGVWRDKFAAYLMRKTVPIDCVVCDESHRIKSPGSKCSRFLARLGRKVVHKYLVTGTPLAESPLDIYAQYRFLDTSIFGTSYAVFRDRYQNLDMARTMAVGFPVLDRKQPYIHLDELREKVFSIAFSMPSSVKLPEQNTRTYTFKLSERASHLYMDLSQDGILKGKDGWTCETENALTLQLRKQQLVSGFITARKDTENGERIKFFKADDARESALQEILESLAPSEPVVIFAQYVKDLQAIKRTCARCGRVYAELSGSTDTEKEWQEGRANVLAVQFQRGAESADFTRARYCIYYSMTLRLALYLQSRKRIHRPGQMRPVYYIHLVAHLSNGRETIDDKILEAVRMKKDIVTHITEGESNGIN